MNTANPVLGMAFYSLMNALELYQSKDDEERHRFGTIILMDLSIEYLLKAKLYQINSADFIENQQELGYSNLMDMNEKLAFSPNEKNLS